jgi:hypothetical protein
MATPKLKVGDLVWIPCEVKPGPFSNERVVRVATPDGSSWVGFVDVRYLKEPIEKGTTAIKARVLSINHDTFEVSLPGHSVASSRVIQKEKAQVSLAAVSA